MPAGPDIVIPSARGLLGEPAKVHAHLQYARENVARSRRLFQEGDLRYAIFSANEGLELCVKGYLLHYKAIADPIDAGHFPHMSIIKSIRKSSASFGEANPGKAVLVRRTASLLDEFEGLFKKLKSRKARVALWKKSLGIDPRGNEQKILDGLGSLATKWSDQEPPRARADFLQGGIDRDPAVIQPNACGMLRAPLLALFHQKFERADASTTISLQGGKKIPLAKTLYVGQLIALTDLFTHTTAIVNGFVHQQISRYPTQIDGVDSGEVYARHRGGVGRLLGKIYGTCDALMPHLDSRLPLPSQPPLLWGVRAAPTQE